MNPAQKREEKLNAIQSFVKSNNEDQEKDLKTKDELIKKVAFDFKVTQRKAKEYIETLEGGNVLEVIDNKVHHKGE